MKLDKEVGVGPGQIVLDGNPAPPPKRGTAPPPIFGPCLLWPNGWLDQNTTWYEGRRRPRRHCVRWGPECPLQKGHRPQLSADVCCGQTAGWIKMPRGMEEGIGSGHIVLDGDPAPPKTGTDPKFPPMSILAKRSPISSTAEHLLRVRSSSILEFLKF